MKFSEQWLREWINPPISTSQLAEQLTLAGLEVDSITPVAADFEGVVVGHVLKVQQHPDADRLRVCTVDVGSEQLQIVCGGQNVREDQKVPVAMINAVLPGNFKIKKSKLRGVESMGMICSETELGIAESSQGIMELAQDAPVGISIRDYLALDDYVMEVELTPNRGDCLSILGIAREVAAINNQTPPLLQVNPSPATISEQVPITIAAPDACPHYMGRVIRQIDPRAQTPIWMKERLRRGGIRPIYLVVDVTNYVLLEIGQPLHAFDLKHVCDGVAIRFAQEKESITLIEGETIQLNTSDLVIANTQGPVALAGVKGGSTSAINENTQDIFLESALFNSRIVAQTARHYGIFTDSSHRYERGVDYQLQRAALERASELILQIAGGQAAQILEKGYPFEPKTPVQLRESRISKLLGISISQHEIENILQRLNLNYESKPEGWLVTPPSYRYDLNEEIDLVEEIARIHGYHAIPGIAMPANLQFLPTSQHTLDTYQIRSLLVNNGYHEAITYSFVDPHYELQLGLQKNPLTLLNPISSELSVMRANHWSGLIQAYLHNYNRQQNRVRLFEMGLCFNNGETLIQENHLGMLAAGSNYNEQWGESKRSVDFFDLKQVIEDILSLTGKKDKCGFEPCEHPALHPGQAAAIFKQGQHIGLIGALHPSLAQEFGINQSVYLVDLNLSSIMDVSLPKYEMLSKFPAIKRDLALVVTANVHAERIRQKILDSGGELLKNVQIFDIYQGSGIEQGKKSIALSLNFQHPSRTLVDSEVNELMQEIVHILHKDLNATLRD